MPTISNTIIRSGKRVLVLAASIFAAQVLHGGLNPGVAQLPLDRHDTGSAIEHCHGQRMTEQVGRDALGDPGPSNGFTRIIFLQILGLQRVAHGDR